MTRTRIAAILSALLLLSLTPGALTAAELDTPESQTDNMEHIDTVTYERHRGSSWWATDSDFVEFTAPAGWEPPAFFTEETGLEGPPADYVLPAEGEQRVFNLMGSRTNGMWITDVTDPENATVVSRWDCGINQADVFVFSQEGEDGSVRTYAAYTQDALDSGARDSQCFLDIERITGEPLPGNSRGTFIADVTDPYRPQTVSFLPMAKGTHQTTVHPSGDYIYNSAAVLSVNADRIGSIEVYDVSDPSEPALVTELMLETGLDSHDMSFSEDGERLFVAALTHSFIIDTSDPADPQIISRIFDPAINIHHDAHRVTVEGPLGERDFLLLGDELGGATPTGVCPGGGIHVYDITGELEQLPVKVGAFFIPEVRLTPADVGGVRTCTAHVIQPLPGTTLLSVAWYNAGVRILDYAGLADLGPVGPGVGAAGQSAPAGLVEVGHSRFADSSLWSAKVYEVAEDGSFYIFGGDMSRALDIWKFTPDGEGASADSTGTWMSPDQAMRAALAVRNGVSTLTSGLSTPVCLLQ